MRDSITGFREEGYRVTWALTRSQRAWVHRLRAEVFCRELAWVGSSSDSVEQDEFDARAVHMAVLDEQRAVVATVRLAPAEAPWMLTTVFRRLLPAGTRIERAGAMEASRMAVAKRARVHRLASGRRVCDLLYKGAYLYCALHGIRHLYMVTSDVVLRHMRNAGLPCQPLGDAVRMEDGVKAIAVLLDWEPLRERRAVSDWHDSAWCGRALVRRGTTSDPAGSGQAPQLAQVRVGGVAPPLSSPACGVPRAAAS